MAITVTPSFHTSLCETLYSDLVSGREKFYYFIGNTIPWNLTDLPPEYEGTFDEENQIRNDLIAVKKITPSDIAFGTKRYDWMPSIVFDRYQSAINLVGKKFYVLTDEFNVYKCLSNNNGALSTEKPTGVDYTPQNYSDGYWWKYMYSIPKSMRNKFLSPDVMPVFRSLTDSFYDDGNIREVFVNNGGDGYQNEAPLTVTTSGGSPSTLAVLKAIVGTSGEIIAIKIVDGGYYDTVPEIVISGNPEATGLYPPNTGAKAEAVLKDNKIDRIYITDPGVGYENDLRTTIVVEGDGEGAVLIPFIDNGVITDVFIEDEGRGYSFANIIVVSAFDSDLGIVPGNGAILTANLSLGNLDSVQAIVEQTAIPGAIHATNILSGGNNYVETDLVIFDGDGFNAEGTLILNNGSVVGINMVNTGSNYSFANISIVSTLGTGAVLKPVISPIRGHGANAVEELLCDSIILSSTINNDPVQDVVIQNDYRQYGLIKNIREYIGTKEYNKQNGSSCFKAVLDNASILQKDDNITIANAKKYTVVDTSGNIAILKPNNNKDVVVGESGIVDGTLNQFTILEVVLPQINKFSGTIQYVNNQMAIDYSAQQLLTLKTVITL